MPALPAAKDTEAASLVCPPPVAMPACPATPPPQAASTTDSLSLPAPDAPLEPLRGTLTRGSWSALPAWSQDDPAAALAAFLKGCPVLATQPAWKRVCEVAQATPRQAALAFFQNEFEPFQVNNPDASASGLVTGYYEPLLRGAKQPTARYRYPIYAAPRDLLSIEVESLHPDLKHKRLRGRIDGNRVVPYYSRGEIDSKAEPLKGLELAWVDDAVELFFLHIQGSGQIQLESGERMRVGYADQNGHPFRSLGGLLIRRGELRPEQASMQGIKAWAARHPRRIQEFMNANPSYVFFKELPNDLSGPLGTLGVPLTPERSIAVDPRVIPLGVPVYLATTWPNTNQPLTRLMVAQDTGGAINGAVRADYYWGFGDAAGQQAGRMKQAGRMWVLLPKGYDPGALPASVQLTQTGAKP